MESACENRLEESLALYRDQRLPDMIVYDLGQKNIKNLDTEMTVKSTGFRTNIRDHKDKVDFDKFVYLFCH